VEAPVSIEGAPAPVEGEAAAPAPVPAPDLPRDEAPRPERPRDRDRDRERRPRRGEEGPRRDREREGSRRRDRGGRDRGEQAAREPAAATSAGGEQPPVRTPVGEPPVVPPGMEFWEAWVEQRTQSSPAPALPPEGGAEPVEGTAAEAAASSVENGAEGSEGESRAPAPVEPGMARLYLNLGRRDGVRTDEVVQLLAERAGLAEAPRVQVRNTHTYITVREEDAQRVITSLNGGTFGERALLCEPARGY